MKAILRTKGVEGVAVHAMQNPSVLSAHYNAAAACPGSAMVVTLADMSTHIGRMLPTSSPAADLLALAGASSATAADACASDLEREQLHQIRRDEDKESFGQLERLSNFLLQNAGDKAARDDLLRQCTAAAAILYDNEVRDLARGTIRLAFSAAETGRTAVRVAEILFQCLPDE